jgi:hypothetical protein
MLKTVSDLRAGAVDMRRLSDPTLDRETESATVAEILGAGLTPETICRN